MSSSLVIDLDRVFHKAVITCDDFIKSGKDFKCEVSIFMNNSYTMESFEKEYKFYNDTIFKADTKNVSMETIIKEIVSFIEGFVYVTAKPQTTSDGHFSITFIRNEANTVYLSYSSVDLVKSYFHTINKEK